MKLAKLSLAAMVVAGLATSSFAADTLADAFAKGKVSGELRAWYFDRDTNTVGLAKGDESILNTGLVLGYVTDSFYGFNMGATMQSNFAAGATSADKNLFYKDEFGSGAVLSEAYLGYKIKNTTAKIGRQFIATPLVAGSGSRMIKESYEGATIVNTDIPATTLVAGYVSKFQGRTTGAFGATPAASDIPEFTKKAAFAGGAAVYTFDGAYTAAVINKSISNLTLTGQYVLVQDVQGTTAGDVDVYHVEAGYVLPMNGFELGFGAAYRASSADKAAVKYDGNYLGAKVTVAKLAGFGAGFAYGTSDSTDDLIAGMGNGADSLYTGTTIRGGANTYQANTDSYKFNVSYDFAQVGVAGLVFGAEYAVAKQDAISVATLNRTVTGAAGEIDYTTYGANLTYAFSGALKGFTAALQYESQEKEVGTAPGVDTNEFRFLANYKF